ncbi:MAG TPA: hypothetical protein VGU71_22365 [Candidatus Dormibacteraeota bacterium]|nr:hypothetical protein [Candidatus Dormibacteraeota bacterium]
MRLARWQLDDQLADDLVQEAIARWLHNPKRWPNGRFRRQHNFHTQAELYVWLRTTIGRLAVDLARRHRDVLDIEHLSLDEARGE